MKSKSSIKRSHLTSLSNARSKNGIVEDWGPGTIVQSDIFVYTNFGTPTECKMRILGIAEAGTMLNDTGSYY